MLNISVLTPNKLLYEGSVNLIEVPGEKGRFQILKNHAPIISNLVAGSIIILDKNQQEQKFEIITGVIECADNKVTILIES